MSDIHIHRNHQLGLARARKVALRWAENAEKTYDVECTILEGETSDTVEFKRSGFSGTMNVAGDHFTLDVKLGFLLKAFAGRIEAEATKELESALAKEATKMAAAAAKKKPAA